MMTLSIPMWPAHAVFPFRHSAIWQHRPIRSPFLLSVRGHSLSLVPEVRTQLLLLLCFVPVHALFFLAIIINSSKS